jgi:hypothetical protein
MTDVAVAQRVAQEIASQFGVPVPRIIVGPYPTAQYTDGTIYLPNELPPQYVARVTAHEMAHHLHVHFGVPCKLPECESFAKIFEEVWRRARGYSYPVMSCQVCGFPVLLYEDSVQCFKCKSTYRRVYKHPSPGLGKALGLGALSAVGAYALASWLKRRPELARVDPAATSAVVSGVVGFFAGLVL